MREQALKLKRWTKLAGEKEWTRQTETKGPWPLLRGDSTEPLTTSTVPPTHSLDIPRRTGCY